MRVSVYMGMSVDGFVARLDDRLDFLPLPPDDDDMGFSAFLSSVDVIVMGRRTFEVVLAHADSSWPYGDKPVVVLSRTVQRIPGARASVSVGSGEPAEIIASLEGRGLRHAYIDGAATARAFLAAGLVDQIDVTTVPVLIGTGISLWGALPADVALEHVETRVRRGGLVQTRYRVVGGAAFRPRFVACAPPANQRSNRC
jgi:dihydrofolate reductase